MPAENPLPAPKPDTSRERQQPAPRPGTFPQSISEYGKAYAEREELRASEPPPGSDDYVRHREQENALTERVRTFRREGLQILATYLMTELQRVGRAADYSLFLNGIKHACEKALLAQEQAARPQSIPPRHESVAQDMREGTQATLEGGASGT